MKKHFSFVLVFLLIGIIPVFAKATTDIEVGFIYGHGIMTKNETSSGVTIENIKTDGCGFNLGCDVEITDKFGLFVDFGFLFPSKTEITAKANGISLIVSDKSMFDVVFEINSLMGPEFVHYFNDSLKLRVGGGINIAGLVLQSDANKIVESDLLYGLGAKIDFTYQFNKIVGINFGCNMSFLFTGSSETTYVSRYGNTTTNGTLDDFTFFIAPNISVIFHIGGKH